MQAPPTALIFSSATREKNLGGDGLILDSQSRYISAFRNGKRLVPSLHNDWLFGKHTLAQDLHYNRLTITEYVTNIIHTSTIKSNKLPTLQKPALETSITGALSFTPAYFSRVCRSGWSQNVTTVYPIIWNLFRDERPELVQVHSWLVEVRVVRVHVEVPHANLTIQEVSILWKFIQFHTFPK